MNQLFDPNPVTHSNPKQTQREVKMSFNDLPMDYRTTENWLIDINPNLSGSPRMVAELFKAMAEALQGIPNCAEKSAGMRKLLEAKDCFVRSVVR